MTEWRTTHFGSFSGSRSTKGHTMKPISRKAFDLKNLLGLAAFSLFAITPMIALTGCDTNDGPAEEAGEALDDAADDVGDALDDASDEVDDAIDP